MPDQSQPPTQAEIEAEAQKHLRIQKDDPKKKLAILRREAQAKDDYNRRKFPRNQLTGEADLEEEYDEEESP